MRYRKLGLLLGLALIAVAVVGTASASSSKSSIPVIKDSQMQAKFTTIGGGAAPLPTTRTIQVRWAPRGPLRAGPRPCGTRSTATTSRW